MIQAIGEKESVSWNQFHGSNRQDEQLGLLKLPYWFIYGNIIISVHEFQAQKSLKAIYQHLKLNPETNE